jgi:PhnB protein
MAHVTPIPEGHHSLTTSIVVSNAARALDFYKKALGAVEISRFPTPDGKIAHAEIRLGDSRLMLTDEFGFAFTRSPESLGGTPATLWLYVDDVDSAFKRAVDAGATVKWALKDQFWGDRTGHIADPFGHMWVLATHKEDVAPGELKRRGDAEMAKMAAPQRTQSA